MTVQPLDEEAIFHAARALGSPAERADYLAQSCGDNQALRARVEGLLKIYADEKSFAAMPSALLATLDHQPISERPGTVIGPYKLMEQIGEGGFGLVFVAEQQQPVRRKVALKVIKPGMDTRDVIARFEAERQALALMDHPNIARVFDAGATDSGRPYFVMELVRGIPITEYCDQQHLTPRERLELFVALCHAIQHAHQKGIIHRDVKPSNVLVTEHDGRPVVKVIDFGVAKALSQQLTQHTIYTQFAQMIGTPLYMSPEQAAMSGLDIDTRTDIYSLGVLLYELLTGTTPFDRERLREAAADEIRRIIREEEPPKPSTRLSESSELLPSIAEPRKTELANLSKLVRGDLDWIVMKCLEKDRNRRYETANGLALDIKRYLNDEPIIARPPTGLYRFQKLIRRNKVAFAAISAVIAALVVGLGISTWMYAKERVARKRADAAEQHATSEAVKSEQVADFMKGMLKGVGPSVALGSDTKMLREILDQTAQRLNNDLKDHPAVEAELRATLGNVYFDLGEYPRAEAVHHQALKLRKKLSGEKHPSVADSLNDLGQVFYGQGKYAEASAAHREALVLRRTLLGNEHLAVTQSLGNLAESLRRQGPDKFAEADPLFREALALRRKMLGSEHREVAQSLSDFGMLLLRQRKLSEAESVHREALAIRRKLYGNEHPDVATALDRLGVTLHNEGKRTEAEPVFREALAMRRKIFGGEHPDLAHSLHNLGNLLIDQGQLAEAEALFRESFIMRRKLLGEKHLDVRDTLDGLADALARQGNREEAEALFRTAVAVDPKDAGTNGRLVKLLIARKDWDGGIEACHEWIKADPKAALPHRHLGEILFERGNIEGAIAAYRRSIELDPYDALSHFNLGVGLRIKEDLDGAIVAFRRSIELNPNGPGVHHNLGWALQSKGNFDGAIAAFRRAIEIYPTGPGAYKNLVELLVYKKNDWAGGLAWCRKAIEADPKAAWPHDYLGSKLREKGDLDGAIEAYRKAIEVNPEHFAAYYNLVDLLYKKKDWDGVIAWCRKWMEADPKAAAPHFEFGRALLNQGAFEGAIVAFRRSIELDPNAALPHYRLGYALYRKGDIDGAITSYRRSIELDPYVPGIYSPLGIALDEKGDLDGAIAAFRRATEIDPHGPWGHYFLGGALAEKGDFDGAIAGYRRAIEVDPKYLSAYFALASLLEKEGKLPEAEATLRDGLKGLRANPATDEPNLDFALANLTSILIAEKKFAEAEVTARECLEIREQGFPDDWRTFNTRSLLGGSLLGQKKYVEAEPFLKSGYEGMKQRKDKIPDDSKVRLREALERIVRLYEATDQPDKAAEWKQRLTEFVQAEPEKPPAAPEP